MNKYIWGSLILIIISVIGIRWILNDSAPEKVREEAINAIYPTSEPKIKTSTTPAKAIVGSESNKGGLTDANQTIFESAYSPDRKLYIEKEFSGTRYVLWKPDSKITVHVGNSWSWVHPRRDLTETDVVPNQKTFTYEIGSQKIVDFVDGGKKYTIQCVHNGYSEVKAECSGFLKNFKLI